MKMFLKSALIAAIIVSATATELFSQSNNKVEVKREYDGDLTNTNKSSSKIDIDDSLKRGNLKMDYKIFDRKVKDLYDFAPLPSNKISRKMRAQYPTIIAKGSLTFPLESDASIYFYPHLSSTKHNNSLTFNLKHHSEWHNRKIAQWDNSLLTESSDYKGYAQNNSNGGGVEFSHFWSNGEFKIDANYSTNYHTYYGIDKDLYSYFALPQFDIASMKSRKYMKNNLSHRYNLGEVNFSVRSYESAESKNLLNYSVDVTYSNLSDKAKIMEDRLNLYENYFKVDVEAGPNVGKYSMITVGITSESALYGSYQDFNTSLLDVYAKYRMNNQRWMLNIGARGSINFNNKSGYDKYHYYIFPFANISYAIDPECFWAYANVDGSNSLNSYSSLLELTQRVSPATHIRESSIPIIARVGFRGLLVNNLSADIYVGAARHRGMVQFINNATPAMPFAPLDIIYSNHKEFFVGGELKYEDKRVKIGVEAKYSSYTKGKSYRGEQLANFPDFKRMKPIGYAPLESHLYIEYNMRERIYLGADIFTHSRTFVSPLKIKSKTYNRIGVYGKYVIDNNYSVFASVNNLLNSDIQNLGMYMENRRNFSFGVLIKW